VAPREDMYKLTVNPERVERPADRIVSPHRRPRLCLCADRSCTPTDTDPSASTLRTAVPSRSSTSLTALVRRSRPPPPLLLL
jgi:hypothetical protein